MRLLIDAHCLARLVHENEPQVSISRPHQEIIPIQAQRTMATSGSKKRTDCNGMRTPATLEILRQVKEPYGEART